MKDSRKNFLSGKGAKHFGVGMALVAKRGAWKGEQISCPYVMPSVMAQEPAHLGHG